MSPEPDRTLAGRDRNILMFQRQSGSPEGPILLNMVEVRCSPATQWEIRKVTMEILKILKEKAPTVFGDFEIDLEKDGIRKTAI